MQTRPINIDDSAFGAWVDYCFNWFRHLLLAVPEEIAYPGGPTLALYFRMLFESSELLQSKKDDEITAALSFIFSHDSEYWFSIRNEGVAQEDQARAVLALVSLYQNCLDRRCDSRGSDPARSTNGFNSLDGRVYMLWDMDCIEGAAMNSSELHLVDPIFTVLETAIHCKTVACQISGLHGLGHLESYHPDRVRSLIGAFLSEGRAALPWVHTYALEAIKGNVL